MKRPARIVAGVLAMAFILAAVERAAHYEAQAHLVRYPDSPAKNHLENRAASQLENLRHARYVARHGGGRNRLWHLKARLWLKRELAETRRALRPERVTTTGDPCLDEIIDRETVGTWDPTIYNYAGSGAYGLPQALPGSKMASAGPDWRTNPWTQIRWMRGYVNGRYGGSCAALSFHNRHGWY